VGYCPNCRWEYELDVLVCPACGAALAEARPGTGGAAERPDRSWVAMGRVLTSGQSKIAKASLDAGNIPSVILPTPLYGAGRSAAPAAGLRRAGDEGQLIMVPREFERDAQMALAGVLGSAAVEFGRFEEREDN